MKLAAVSITLLAGCAQILGLENTELDRKDAAVDAPSSCDQPAFECTAGSGRSVCGQLVVAGTGLPFRVADPMGQICSSSEGPCGLTVFGQSLATYYGGTSGDRVMAQVDDCGHFLIRDLDPSPTDLAIGISGAEVATSARLLLDLAATTSGTETGVEALVVPTATKAGWATQLAISETEIASGYLVRYLTIMGVAVPMEEVRVSGAPVGGPITRPWAAFFTGEFDTLDPALMKTTAGGTVFIAPPSTTFILGGVHVGKQCFRDGFQDVSNTLVYVVMKDC